MYQRTLFINIRLPLIIFLNHILGSTSLYSTHTNSILGPSNHREAYFNGSSYIRLLTTISLQRHTGLSFRTCIGGELFSQQYSDNIVAITVTKNGLEFLAATATTRFETKIIAHLLDNRWHTISLEYRLGNLTVSVAGQTELIANKTFNPELLTNSGLSNEGSILIVGKQFSGCILEGPSIVFNTSFIHPHDIIFGQCPILTNSCIPRLDLVQTRKEDHCFHEPCMRHGVCVSRPDKYECHCTPRYSGNNCELDNGSPCKITPPKCLNGATCIEDKQGNYTCACQQGYTGKFCDSELSIHPLCVPEPCMNNGTCRVLPGSNVQECVCTPGFTGSRCENDINECQPNPCENGGSCVDGPNNYTCYCSHIGYGGTNCEININECTQNPCLNQGVCFDTYGSYVCQCQEGFDGQNCELNLNECVSMPCLNRGSCIDKMGGYECLCPPGYSGANCELSVCDGVTCPSYAECREHQSGYRCVCKSGYSGIYPNCTEGNSPCLNTPCLNRGTCLPYMDSFNCTCPPGYTGKHCQLNLDECISMPCLNGGTCIDQVNGFFCNCTGDFMGTTCERPYDICELKPCKNNATCVTNNKRDFVCDCLPGFSGLTCENNIDECMHIKCPEGRVCIDLVAGYECRCPDGFTGDNCSLPIDPCAKTFCQNGGTCKVIQLTHSFTCACQQGFTGRYCEEDIDECVNDGVPVCTHGICVNTHGSFQCYCMPGYTGETCSVDFDECLSQPCKNNATCLNRINNYECVCTPGYTGKDCNVDINECDSSPCFNGSTCIDGIASFKCVCQPGLTGRLCHINIDDCQSSPCRNDGHCIDGLNSYTCNCTDTGYSGLHCENNIDDCQNNPCANGAECIDGVKDYSCNCHPGYTGKNCEIDINECESSPCQYSGTCIQRSNMALYMSENKSLPAIYAQPFSYENASGYECICIAGVTGKDCETDINECDSSPCQRGGTCRDKIDGYSCDCVQGVEGENCEFDINECDRYTPCVHGTCVDLKANYFCDCQPNYGGKNCSVELVGCMENPCSNNGTCKPYLENEVHHKFNCSCPNGFHGDTCEKITTMSLSGASYIAVNTSRDEGYDIQFRFKTTLGDGLLAIGKGLTYYILELVHGRLNLHSSLLNKWEGVFIGSGLNDSKWQKVFVAINSSHLVLAANEEQTIYPINLLNEGSNATHTSFPTTYLGGTISELRRLTHGPSSFVGCTEDVIINGEWVLPQNISWMSLVDVEVGCSRTPQCNPNPCHSGGRCTDKWRTFSCTCERPYLGHTCQYNYTAATFGYENITNSLVTVTVTDKARRAVRSIVDISMFIRTRQSAGQIFYIGSTLSGASYNDDNHISAKLEAGELLVSILFNGTPESYTVSGVKLDNGFNHLIEVIRNVTLVQVKLNGTEYFRKTISGTGQLDAQVLYLGGLPELRRPVRQTDNAGMRMDTTTSSAPAAFTTPSVNFKGIIQDVQISNGSRRMIVEFFNLEVDELEIPVSFGKVLFDTSTLKEGVVSDDLCQVNPCEHNGTCTVTWNDFRCHCPRGFKGKTCADLEFCQVFSCPTGSQCKNLEDSYECIANATFDGKTKPLMYNFAVMPTVQSTVYFPTIEINFRTKVGGTIMFVQNVADYFFVFIYKDQVTVQWSLASKTESHRFSKDNRNGNWHTLHFAIKDREFSGGFNESDTYNDDPPNIMVNDFNVTLFSELFQKGKVYLGGSDRKSYELLSLHNQYTKLVSSSYLTNGSDAAVSNTIDIPINTLSTEVPIIEKVRDKFKGCLGEIRIGGILLPYFMMDEIYLKNNTLERYFSLLPDSEHQVGCSVCFESDCLNSGHCLDAEQSYQCNCAPGYTAEDCSVDIDECMENKCQNNATCMDGIANFTCVCNSGYEGWLCEMEIDECQSNPCRNGGTCIDQLATYECVCTEDYVGRQCEALRLITCENQPCRNESTCSDGSNEITGNNFTCTCTKGMVGALCDTPFCIPEPCRHGLCNETNPEPFCQCDRGYAGVYCEQDINDCILPTGDSPCQHRGHCIDEIDKYICNCTQTGYRGLLCELDVDECQQEYICGQYGTCENTPGSYKCHCPDGMCGMYCAIPDPCLSNPCGEYGHCNSTCKLEPSYNCDCLIGYSGPFCNETTEVSSSSDEPVNIALIIIPIVALLLLGGAAGLAILVAMARSKRATRGTYSPSAQEFCNPRVELDQVLKPPPEERLI